MMLPPVSLAMAKATQPAAVAAPGPALLPELPSSISQGAVYFLVGSVPGPWPGLW